MAYKGQFVGESLARTISGCTHPRYPHDDESQPGPQETTSPARCTGSKSSTIKTHLGHPGFEMATATCS